MLPAIAALALISALTIDPAAIAARPLLSIEISPVIPTLVIVPLVAAPIKKLPEVTVTNLLRAIAALAAMFALAMLPSIIVDVTVSVSPLVITVPVIFGSVKVLSAVGSVIERVNSWALSVAPSKTKLPAVPINN